MDEISSDARLNIKILHLEGEKVFGSSKHKLDLPSGNERDSYHHDCVNYNVPKLSKEVSPSQCCSALMLSIIAQNQGLAMPITLSTFQLGIIWKKNRLQILPCCNLMS